VAAVAAEVGGRVVSVREALTAAVDFLAPCATGEMIGTADVPALACQIISGGANNPLVDDTVAAALHGRGILYVPDFMSNAGGVIQNAVEFRKEGWPILDQLLAAANDRTLSVLQRASDSGQLPLDLARSEALASVASGTSSHAAPKITA
jgi:leucine dehydrogenase